MGTETLLSNDSPLQLAPLQCSIFGNCRKGTDPTLGCTLESEAVVPGSSAPQTSK